MAANLLIFVPVGVFGFLALRPNFRPAVAVTVTLLFALVLSSSIEMTQLFDDERWCTATDVVFNVSGTAAGVVLGCLYQQWLRCLLARA
jgi:glycopeptide antibiotics resistance protein